MEHLLAEEGFKTASLHGEIPPRYREKNFRRFKDQEEGCKVLVATDLASRGLDIPSVSHIINFDFPKTTSDYLHRAGRAGRAGRPGFVLSLYRQRDMPILQQMQESHDSLEPMQIGSSAFSRRAKQEEMSQLGVQNKQVRLGSVPKDHIASKQRYIGGANRRNAKSADAGEHKRKNNT